MNHWSLTFILPHIIHTWYMINSTLNPNTTVIFTNVHPWRIRRALILLTSWQHVRRFGEISVLSIIVTLLLHHFLHPRGQENHNHPAREACVHTSKSYVTGALLSQTHIAHAPALPSGILKQMFWPTSRSSNVPATDGTHRRQHLSISPQVPAQQRPSLKFRRLAAHMNFTSNLQETKPNWNTPKVNVRPSKRNKELALVTLASYARMLCAKAGSDEPCVRTCFMGCKTTFRADNRGEVRSHSSGSQAYML